MYHLFAKQEEPFKNRKHIRDFEDADDAYDYIDKKLAEDKNFKYVLEETTLIFGYVLEEFPIILGYVLENIIYLQLKINKLKKLFYLRIVILVFLLMLNFLFFLDIH